MDYFENGVGGRPNDHYWTQYRQNLGSRTNNICWYCERQCYSEIESGRHNPTIDHFRPISGFPRMVYEWSNWVFSCQRCNGDNKKDNWPETGYVDPCAVDEADRPERYFDYDAATGEIIPRDGLSATARSKSSNTIDDLGMNLLDLKYYRLEWTRRFTNDLLMLPASEQLALIDLFVEQPAEYAGITGMVVEQLRRAGSI